MLPWQENNEPEISNLAQWSSHVGASTMHVLGSIKLNECSRDPWTFLFSMELFYLWYPVPLTSCLFSPLYFLNSGSPVFHFLTLFMEARHFGAQHFPSFVYVMLKIKLRALHYQLNTPVAILFSYPVSWNHWLMNFDWLIACLRQESKFGLCYSILTENSSPWPPPTASSGG